MIANAGRVVLVCLLPASILDTPVGSENTGHEQEAGVMIQYLEIVTPDVDATCGALEAMRGVSFGEPVPEFGDARTAPLENGGRIGVRAPMRETEDPVVRPYLLVEDIEAAVDAARASGAEIAMTPTEIPGQGRFAIYILGGIEHGLWQL
jgi:predicted enzyme related to lactoylglutathione lyase